MGPLQTFPRTVLQSDWGLRVSTSRGRIRRRSATLSVSHPYFSQSGSHTVESGGSQLIWVSVKWGRLPLPLTVLVLLILPPVQYWCCCCYQHYFYKIFFYICWCVCCCWDPKFRFLPIRLFTFVHNIEVLRFDTLNLSSAFLQIVVTAFVGCVID